MFFVFFLLFFFRGGKPSSSTCCYGFVCEGEKLSLLNWTSFFGPHYGQASSPTCLLCSASGVVTSVQTSLPTVPIIHPVQWDMDLFTVSLPYWPLWCTWLADFLWEVGPTSGCHSPAQPVKTRIIDFTDRITLPVLCVCVCVCMFMCWQYVLKDVHGQQWQGKCTSVLNGAILNCIFK